MSKVEICGVDTSRLRRLTYRESEEMLSRIKEGDASARETFALANARLVLSIIKRFPQAKVSSDDLFQAGMIGLMKSIDNFDPTMEVKFSTYAVPMIIGEIRRYLRDNSSIRVSRSMRDTAYRALQAKEAFVNANQREPTIEELSRAMQIPREDIVFALDAILDPVSLYEPVFENGGDAVYVMDQVGDTKNTDEHWLEQIALKEAMRQLSSREQNILRMRFFEGRTQMEVADEIHISQAQVSRLEKSALAHMRKQI